MSFLRFALCALLAAASVLAQAAGKKILFNHTKHEDGGTSAEWVICSASEPIPSPANPTTETAWNGGLSAFGFDLNKAGYAVETLPPGGRITYGDTTNAQDLSKYAAHVLPECYVYFTAAEKQAIYSYVQSGGGLFIIGNHQGASRVTSSVPGSTDAFTVFNDLVSVNGGNPYGFTFIVGHGPGDALANTTSTAFATGTSPAEQAIIHGAYGTLSLMDFHSFAYLSPNTAQNPNVREILHTGIAGDTGSFIVTSTVGAGRVVALSDSSPSDDGTTTTSGKSLHNSYTINSNRAFFMNAVAYLAGDAGPVAPTPVVGIASPASNTTITAGGSISFQGSASIADGSTMTYSWSFGDGTSAAVLGPVAHTYATAGTYVATFTATSNQGKSASATRTITVNAAAFTVTASAGTGGTITPAGAVSVANGGSQTFSIAPSAGYVIGAVTVDGVSQGAIGTYTFTAVTANHTIAASFTASAGSSLSETFDTGTKSAYATGAVSLATGSWTLDDALLGNTTADPKVGTQSVRVRNSGKVTMGFSFATGAKTVTVKHGKYGTDGNATWGLWYSVNGGTTWTQAGTSVTTSSTTLATATFTVNVPGAIRFELRKTDGSANRVNFDDFKIAGY
ncbi:MAG: PKD domain-containing protein [Geothrix sp.]|uniref:PKD domain-containing protein n=1 Tax=Geothrix sp. TaxID=1962974 RepID=UPI0017C45260|nr:PKD domain-containing protein [Geothrix sp.]NWJ41125.1 PKD domain-containing protein [Geothrix sp.]